MFEQLANHTRIVVTGPQRSGTMICSQMIAHDLGLRFVEEREYGVHDEYRWRLLLATEDRIVVQSPGMLKAIVDNCPPDIFVVLMRRDVAAINASARRVHWDIDPNCAQFELAKYGLKQGNPALVAYTYWDEHDKPFPYLELRYDDLAAHPFFLDAAQRGFLDPRETGPKAREWLESVSQKGRE